MKIAVSPSNGAIVRSSRAALSSSRSEVVPTATMRPPLARASFNAAAVDADRLPHSECILWPAGSSAFPDMQRQALQPDAMSVQGGFKRGREMQPRGRRRDCALLRREHGLVVAQVA